jgi:hypothetical protein
MSTSFRLDVAYISPNSTNSDNVRFIVALIHPAHGCAQCLNCRGLGVESPSCWLNPPVVCSTPKQDALGYPGGSVSTPAIVNDAELPVCNDNDNE